jgi:hypothetical protein
MYSIQYTKRPTHCRGRSPLSRARWACLTGWCTDASRHKKCVCACAARLLRGKCLVLVRHAACASVWACAGQRHFVPRTYPGHTKSPLSTPAADPQQGGTTRCWFGEKELPLTALQTGSRRGVAMQVSPNRRAAQRPAPSNLSR